MSKFLDQEVWKAMTETERNIMGVANMIADEAIMMARKKDAVQSMPVIAKNMRKAAMAVVCDSKDANPDKWSRSMFLMLMGAYIVGARGKSPAEMAKLVAKMENITKTNRRNGKIRGEQSSVEVEERWRSRARVEVQSIITKHPKFNQKMVIKEVFETWPKDIDPPPEESLKKYVVRPIFKKNGDKKKNAVKKSPVRMEKP